MDAEKLLNDLIQQSQEIIHEAEGFKSESLELLNYRQQEKSWSILECLEHLNLYGDFYLPEIETRIKTSKHSWNPTFKTTWFANRTVLSMLPKEEQVSNQMNTFKDKNPLNSQLGYKTVERFLNQQKRYVELLQSARKVNLTKVKTNITLPILKFRLGDTFRFVVYHNYRHIVQAKRVYKAALQVV